MPPKRHRSRSRSHAHRPPLKLSVCCLKTCRENQTETWYQNIEYDAQNDAYLFVPASGEPVRLIPQVPPKNLPQKSTKPFKTPTLLQPLNLPSRSAHPVSVYVQKLATKDRKFFEKLRVEERKVMECGVVPVHPVKNQHHTLAMPAADGDLKHFLRRSADPVWKNQFRYDKIFFLELLVCVRNQVLCLYDTLDWTFVDLKLENVLYRLDTSTGQMVVWLGDVLSCKPLKRKDQNNEWQETDQFSFTYMFPEFLRIVRAEDGAPYVRLVPPDATYLRTADITLARPTDMSQSAPAQNSDQTKFISILDFNLAVMMINLFRYTGPVYRFSTLPLESQENFSRPDTSLGVAKIVTVSGVSLLTYSCLHQASQGFQYQHRAQFAKHVEHKQQNRHVQWIGGPTNVLIQTCKAIRGFLDHFEILTLVTVEPVKDLVTRMYHQMKRTLRQLVHVVLKVSQESQRHLIHTQERLQALPAEKTEPPTSTSSKTAPKTKRKFKTNTK